MLERIVQPNDVKLLSPKETVELAEEIRTFLVGSIAKTGGHLASNLGTVELTIALHRVLDFPGDKLIWDVGHQSYTHKILTGRKEEFSSLRKYGGLSGFPKRAESDCDAFDTGHSSTSIAAGLGFAWARDLNCDHYRVVSVIGDGALTGGEAFEALNNAAALKKNFVIVLNDNHMSISENVGSLSKQLYKLRISNGYTGLKDGVQHSIEKIPVYGDKIVATIRRTKSGIKQLVIPGMIFEEMGIMYVGPVDGHNIAAMEKAFREALHVRGPVLVHVLTKKGRGYEPAERLPSRFHGAEPFDVEKGIPLAKRNATYTDVFSTVMRKMGDRDDKLVAVTAAMMDGTGLKRFHNMFPDRFFDVGIAEQYAVTFAAALSVEGLKPVFAVYSSFLQRAYDQILHDVCIGKLPVVFAIDRAGLVGPDGDTHQGIFDLTYLSTIPNMTVMAPKNKWELSDMLKFAISFDAPIALRYPKGEAYGGLKEYRAKIRLGKAEEIFADGEILLFAVGSMVKTAVEARKILEEKGISAAVCNARFVKPLDGEYLKEAAGRYRAILTLEENVISGGFGEAVGRKLREIGYEGTFFCIAIPDTFVEHGSVADLKRMLGLDADGVARKVQKIHKKL
ncbi:MAG: 1-deoxy-D-xylulose-5-phosphate synthase [Lachnospiraceae bacterium]|nr:1-deoxy-D-xylulose-5-phosphate synthase [Lachnospiraceae bacterium]